MKKSKVITNLMVVIAIIVVLNLIFYNLFFRLDFTADQRYTLSKATKNVLTELEDVVTVSAYFSDDLPPQLSNTKEDFEDMLIEYERRAGDNLVYEFINPNENEESEAEAQQKGIGPVMVQVQERDQASQMRAYMGVILSLGEETEIIPLVRPGMNIEYELTTAIKKLTLTEKPAIAFLQGHGEVPMSNLWQLREQLRVLYNPEEFTMTDTTIIPPRIEAMIITNPQDTFPQSHINQLEAYLQQGGSIYLAYNHLQADLNQGYLTAGPEIGLRQWLGSKGISLDDQFAIDVNCGVVTVAQQSGQFRFNTQVEFPYFPIISNFPEHPAGSGLESVILPFVSTITMAPADSSVIITPIAVTSEQSGTVDVPVMVDIQREWTKEDFPRENLPVAVAAEGALAGDGTLSKLIVVSNGEFYVSGQQQPGQQQQQINSDNVSFVANGVDWLADDTGLVELRTKGVTNRPLDPVEDSKRTLIKYGNVFIPVIIILLVAFIRNQQYNVKKRKWLQGEY
jgi:gliding-associated putative ABC transporter substrate-binding component GldG